MKNNLRQQILNELKILLREANKTITAGLDTLAEDVIDTAQDIMEADVEDNPTDPDEKYLDLSAQKVDTSDFAAFLNAFKKADKILTQYPQEVAEGGEGAKLKLDKVIKLLQNNSLTLKAARRLCQLDETGRVNRGAKALYVSISTAGGYFGTDEPIYRVGCRMLTIKNYPEKDQLKTLQLIYPYSATKMDGGEDGFESDDKPVIEKVIQEIDYATGAQLSDQALADEWCRTNPEMKGKPVDLSGARIQSGEKRYTCDANGEKAIPSDATQPSATPAPGVAKAGTIESIISQGTKTIRCPDRSLIIVYQQWLKYVKGAKNLVIDGAYGKRTHDAAKTVFTNEQKNLEALGQQMKDFCTFLQSKKSEWTNDLKGKLPQGIQVGQAERNDPGQPTAPTQPVAGTVGESKNYYDNKKLNEAKILFNKLTKNL